MSVKFQKLVVMLAILAAAALVAVGCGSDDKGDGGGSANLAKKQELVANIGDEAEPGLFNPAGMSYLDAINSKGYVQFAGLYRVVGNDNSIEPWLADGEPEISDDGLTYTIKMRDDAEWSDGEPIVAEDVVTAVNYALEPDTGAYFAGFLTGMVGAEEKLAGKAKGPIDGIKAVDDHTIEIKLKQVVPWFSQLLTIQIFYPLRADQLEKLGKDYGKSTETAVSGPFKLTEYKPGDSIVYEKNDKYFKADDVKLDKITFRMIGEPTTAAQEFTRGDLDTGLQNTMFDGAEIDKWKGEDTFVSGETVGSQYMYMNTTNKELSDPKVRQALALAINRKDIVENITKKGDVPTNIIVPPAVPGSEVWSEGAQDFLSSDGTPDADKAKDLLSEAGWDPKETLTLYYVSDSGNAAAIAEQIQSNLADVGVKVELKPTAGDVFSTVGYGISPVKKDVDLLLQGWIQDYLDAQDWYQLFYSKNIEAGLNGSNYSSEDYDKIYDEAIKTVNDEDRFQLYKQLEAKLTGPDGDMPAAPLYVQADATLTQTWVNDFELLPSGIIYWENLSINEH
ncbi:MAG: peptide ABC transporter substrate-binding protein [Thermoleophilia bacterium]|nr:peptide ABC transporter substrate-binding protein [Thermoleophilia bacterium]